MSNSTPTLNIQDLQKALDEQFLVWLRACSPEADQTSGSDFSQGVIRGFEIITSQIEQGHHWKHVEFPALASKPLPPALWRCVNCKAELPGRSDGACPERCPECRFSQFAEIAQPKPLSPTGDVRALADRMRAWLEKALDKSARKRSGSFFLLDANEVGDLLAALSAQSPPPADGGAA